MDVCLGVDRMLAYFDTSGHDDQTLREIHGKQPAAEFFAWAIQREIFTRDSDGQVIRGKQWGNPAIFCASADDLAAMRALTPALFEMTHAGPRPASQVARAVQLSQAVARSAIYSELDLAVLRISLFTSSS